MATAEQLLLGRWTADFPAAHKETVESTELVFHEDGLLDYIIWGGDIPQRVLLTYRTTSGYLCINDSSVTNAIPFSIADDERLTLHLQSHPCIYRRCPHDYGIEATASKHRFHKVSQGVRKIMRKLRGRRFSTPVLLRNPRRIAGKYSRLR
jgi:hypothetical protein